MTKPVSPAVHYTTRKNKFGDVLCVIKAWSDWGEEGWMVCSEYGPGPHQGNRTTKCFFGDREDAIKDAEFSDYYEGYVHAA